MFAQINKSIFDHSILMMKTKRMKIVFDGQTHQIDANTLINVLIHYQTVISASNKELSGGSKSVELKVNALEKGSFIVDVSVIESIKGLFSANTMEYLANLSAVVGGVYAAYKCLKGKPAKSESEKESIIIKGNDNQTTIINNSIINVYNQPAVRESISKAIETSSEDANVEGVTFDSGSPEPTTFERESFKDYIYNDFDEELSIPEEKIEIVDAMLTIIALNFESGSRWQFLFNGFKIQMIVKDDALMKKIDEGERFGKGDAIHVKMKILKKYNPVYKGYENKSYKIIEFIEHIEAPLQTKMQF